MNLFCLSGMNCEVIYSRLKTQNFTPDRDERKTISQLSCEDRGIGLKKKLYMK